MKLRMLNGSHSFLAYLGYLGGYETIADTMTNLAYRSGFRPDDAEQAPTLSMPEGTDLQAYATLLIARFSNPSLRHRTWQIAMDGSRAAAAPAGSHPSASAKRQLAPSGARRGGLDALTQGIDERRQPIDVVDPLLAEIQQINQRFQGAERVAALLALSGILPTICRTIAILLRR